MQTRNAVCKCYVNSWQYWYRTFCFAKINFESDERRRFVPSTLASNEKNVTCLSILSIDCCTYVYIFEHVCAQGFTREYIISYVTKGCTESFLLGPMLVLCVDLQKPVTWCETQRTRMEGLECNFLRTSPRGFYLYWSFVYLPREKMRWPRKKK